MKRPDTGEQYRWHMIRQVYAFLSRMEWRQLWLMHRDTEPPLWLHQMQIDDIQALLRLMVAQRVCARSRQPSEPWRPYNRIRRKI